MFEDYNTGPSIYETDASGIPAAPASDLARAVQTSLPYAAGEAARRMTRAWAESVGLDLLQGRDGEKYPAVQWRGYWAGSYILWDGNDNAIAPIPPDAVIADCDSPGRCQIAHLPLPPHFSTRGPGGCKHYFQHDGGLPRVLRALGKPLDILGNPRDQELWIKVWGPGYEVLTWHPDAAVLPVSLLKLHAAAVAHAEELRSRLGSVPVEQYLREGIEPGLQSNELWRSACSLAARGHNKLETQGLLRQIADRCELTKGPWTDRQLAGMARRAVEQFGRPVVPQPVLRPLRGRTAEDASPGQEAAQTATPPLTSADHLSTTVPGKRKEDGRQVIAAAQEVSSRVRKALRRRKKHLQAIDPQTLWPSRVDAAATTKALHSYILDLGIEQGSHLIAWVAEKAAAAIGVGIATVNRHLRRLEHHGQLRRGAEGQLIISLSPRSLRPRQKKAGETIGKDEAITLVRKEMQAAVTRPRQISQRELLEITQNQIGMAHFEACLGQGRITPAPPRMSLYRVRQALGVLEANGEFTKIAPAIPEETSPGVWRSDPSTWAPGRIPGPQMPKRRRFGSMKRAYMVMASCPPCTPRDMREAA
jgi:hypothetical protein